MKKELIQSFGGYLRNLRKERGLTLRDVERKVKISNAYLSQIERGERNIPTLKVLSKLSEAYGVSFADLVEKADTKILYDKKKSSIFWLPPTPDSKYIGRAYENLSEKNKTILKKFLQFLLKEDSK